MTNNSRIQDLTKFTLWSGFPHSDIGIVCLETKIRKIKVRVEGKL